MSAWINNASSLTVGRRPWRTSSSTFATTSPDTDGLLYCTSFWPREHPSRHSRTFLLSTQPSHDFVYERRRPVVHVSRRKIRRTARSSPFRGIRGSSTSVILHLFVRNPLSPRNLWHFTRHFKRSQPIYFYRANRARLRRSTHSSVHTHRSLRISFTFDYYVRPRARLEIIRTFVYGSTYWTSNSIETSSPPPPEDNKVSTKQ